jgi:hypothetical protein
LSAEQTKAVSRSTHCADGASLVRLARGKGGPSAARVVLVPLDVLVEVGDPEVDVVVVTGAPSGVRDVRQQSGAEAQSRSGERGMRPTNILVSRALSRMGNRLA